MRKSVSFLLSILALCLGSAFVAQAQSSGSDKLQYTQLWDSFEAAQRKDRPATCLSILDDILVRAEKDHSSSDFYRAISSQYQLRVRINWILADSLKKVSMERVLRFDEPVVSYLFSRTYGSDFNVEAYKARLAKASNSYFYNSLSNSALLDIRNDWEFVMWKEFPNRNEELAAALAGRYPSAAWLEYRMANHQLRDDARRAEMTKLAQKYKGKAIGLYPEYDILSDRLGNTELTKAYESAFVAMKADFQDYQKRRDSFKGAEKERAQLAPSAEMQLEYFVEKKASVIVEDKEGKALLRNAERMEIKCYKQGDEKKQLWSQTLNNPTQSFYVYDTLSFSIPPMDDGKYYLKAKVKGSNDEFVTPYIQKSISIAARFPEGGIEVFAADYLSGEPIENCELVLLDKGEKACIKVASFRNGFVSLPEKWLQMIKNGRKYANWRVICTSTNNGILRSSSEIGIWYSEESSTFEQPVMEGTIMCDRGAYNPGDTLKFKAIAYLRSETGFKVTAPGTQLRVILEDNEGNKVAESSFCANDKGAVAGMFVLPKGRRNGTFKVCLKSEDDELARSHVRVDDFVLPTFDLQFDPDSKYYQPGDTIEVKGRVVAYSGHSLAGSSIRVSISRTKEQITVAPADDGTFSFKFATDSSYSGRWEIAAVVTDATGETQEFNTVRYTGASRLALNVVAAMKTDRYMDWSIVGGLSASVKCEAKHWGETGSERTIPVSYSLYDDAGNMVLSGHTTANKTIQIVAPRYGKYKLEAKVKSGNNTNTASCQILFFDSQSETISTCMPNVMASGNNEITEGEPIKVWYVSCQGASWYVATLFGPDRTALQSKVLKLGAECGKPGSQGAICFDYQPDWPQSVFVQIVSCRDGRIDVFENTYKVKKSILSMPLCFSRIQDEARPGAEVTVGLKTSPKAELLASVYDVTLDNISANHWNTSFRIYDEAKTVSFHRSAGAIRTLAAYDGVLYESASVKAKSVFNSSLRIRGAATLDVDGISDYAVAAACVAEEEIMPTATQIIRENMSDALAFEPFIKPDADGYASFSFRTSDKLSTYKVKVFAHDESMNAASVENQIVVTIPVKVSLVQPKYLYSTDSYTLQASVQSAAKEALKGSLVLELYSGSQYKGAAPVGAQRAEVAVAAGGGAARDFAVAIPAGADTLGVKLSFISEDNSISDALFVTIPVLKPEQSLREAHSALLAQGADSTSLDALLRSRFVNVDGSVASAHTRSLKDMVVEVLDENFEPRSKDVLSLAGSYYAQTVAHRLGAAAAADTSLVRRILACRNSDGGFGWFEGMPSSACITAAVLGHFAKLSAQGFDIPDMEASVRYLDNCLNDSDKLPWYSRISIDRYLEVRSMYPEVELKGLGKEYKKEIKKYLLPKKSEGRGLQGQIFAKAQRIAVIDNLTASAEGLALAKAFGLGAISRSRLAGSAAQDAISLQEYAQKHPGGGVYYPNAVMPFRGLMASEARAHTVLCGVMQSRDSSISEGIRLWLMLQKDTQKWASDPAFVDAVACILNGSEATLNSKILTLDASFSKPFSKIKAAGNEMSIERRFFCDAEGKDEIKPGDLLKAGERVYARYEVWSKENRSYVRLNAPREAMLRPVDQLSGYQWGRGYREVKTDRTVYYFESFPEQKTTWSEEFFVTQKGAFSAPVVEIECVYAPDYRANGSFRGFCKSE